MIIFPFSVFDTFPYYWKVVWNCIISSMCLLQVREPPAHERRRCGLEASPCKDSALKKSLSLVCGETSYSMNFNMWWNILIGYINFLDIIYLYHNLFYTKKIHQSRVHLIKNGQVFNNKKLYLQIGIGCNLGTLVVSGGFWGCSDMRRPLMYMIKTKKTKSCIWGIAISILWGAGEGGTIGYSHLVRNGLYTVQFLDEIMIWAFKVHLKYMLAQGKRKAAAPYFALRGTTHSQQPSFHFEKLSLSAAGCTGLKICCFR